MPWRSGRPPATALHAATRPGGRLLASTGLRIGPPFGPMVIRGILAPDMPDGYSRGCRAALACNRRIFLTQRSMMQPPPAGSTGFIDQLDAAVRRCGTPVMVGLDPRIDLLPEGLRPAERDWTLAAAAVAAFCREVLDVVAPLVPIVKLQAAFFEQLGPAGVEGLANTIRYAKAKGLLVVVDGKRNDIGSTAAAYAEAYLGRTSPFGADALTVSPYLGDDSLQPFVERAIQNQAGVFVLVRTSNPGGGMLQDLVADGQPVYQRVADHVERLAIQTCGQCGYGAVGAVVGATYPQHLAELRARMAHTWFLVPGYGAQGGSARDVAGAFDSTGRGAVINSARGIIFAYADPRYRGRAAAHRWQAAIEAATLDMIAQLRAETAAGKLVTGAPRS